MLGFWIWTNKTLLFLYITCLILQKTLLGGVDPKLGRNLYFGVSLERKVGSFLDSYTRICQKVVKSLTTTKDT